MKPAYITGIGTGGRNDPRHILHALRVITERMERKMNGTAGNGGKERGKNEGTC